MKAAVALLILLTLMPACASGGPSSTGLAGDQSLKFSIERWAELGEFQGQLISYQRFLSDRRAVRLAGGLSLDRNNQGDDFTYEGHTGDIETTDWDALVTVKAQMVFYEGEGPLYFIWGVGPKVTYENYHAEYAYARHTNDEIWFDLRSYDEETFGLGLQGFAGIEWFINDRFSLHAEYGASAMYEFLNGMDESIASNDVESYTKTETDSNGPQFTSDGVLFGISGHF